MTADDDHDTIDWDEWLAMSDAEQEAEWQSALRQYNEMIDHMTPDELFHYRRSRNLDLCIKIRSNMKAFPGIEIFRHSLRDTQRRLLALRIEHRTGLVVGHA